ncbi:hypothetical protein F5Y18DRAFT_429924 [Xylariaceae sp. FL1019]|nr:hypothetical protein F5Y18DRAFT_429924 [Xylariaceae sp. FL1019]
MSPTIQQKATRSLGSSTGASASSTSAPSKITKPTKSKPIRIRIIESSTAKNTATREYIERALEIRRLEREIKLLQELAEARKSLEDLDLNKNRELLFVERLRQLTHRYSAHKLSITYTIGALLGQGRPMMRDQHHLSSDSQRYTKRMMAMFDSETGYASSIIRKYTIFHHLLQPACHISKMSLKVNNKTKIRVVSAKAARPKNARGHCQTSGPKHGKITKPGRIPRIRLVGYHARALEIHKLELEIKRLEVEKWVEAVSALTLRQN